MLGLTELYVFDTDLNRLGIIDAYTEVEVDWKYQNHSNIFFVCGAEYKSLLISDDDRIIVKSNDLHRGFLIDAVEYEDELELKMIVNGKSMGNLLNRRLILGQQRFNGNIEDVFKAFVNVNCINPTDPKRVIPNLVLGVNQGINLTIDVTYANALLDITLWELAVKYDIAYEILLNHKEKKFVFSTYQGIDRSYLQDVNPRIVFAKAFDNVNLQSYYDDNSNFKNMAYAAGEGEGAARMVVPVNDSVEGLSRREIFVDARDLQSTYRNQNNEEITIPATEYRALLVSRGESKLSEHQRIQSFSSENEINAQYQFNRDYALGDRVSVRNDELNIIAHPRIVAAKETFTRNSYGLKTDFGTAIPTPLEKIMRKGLR